jgi:hypothetical protein
MNRTRSGGIKTSELIGWGVGLLSAALGAGAAIYAAYVQEGLISWPINRPSMPGPAEPGSPQPAVPESDPITQAPPRSPADRECVTRSIAVLFSDEEWREATELTTSVSAALGVPPVEAPPGFFASGGFSSTLHGDVERFTDILRLPRCSVLVAGSLAQRATYERGSYGMTLALTNAKILWNSHGGGTQVEVLTTEGEARRSHPEDAHSAAAGELARAIGSRLARGPGKPDQAAANP